MKRRGLTPKRAWVQTNSIISQSLHPYYRKSLGIHPELFPSKLCHPAKNNHFSQQRIYQYPSCWSCCNIYLSQHFQQFVIKNIAVFLQDNTTALLHSVQPRGLCQTPQSTADVLHTQTRNHSQLVHKLKTNHLTTHQKLIPKLKSYTAMNEKF